MIAGAVLLCAVSGCSVEQRRPADSGREVSPATSLPEPAVARLQERVRGDIERYVGVEQAAVIKALARAETDPVNFKLRIALQALTNPWAGLTVLERHGLRIAEAARAGTANLPALIAALEAGAGRAPESFMPLPIPTSSKPEDHIAYLVAVLEQAHQLREKALRKLSRDDRRFLFEHAASLVERFIPQVEGLDGRTMPQAQADRRFCRLVDEQLDYSALIAAAQVLARLADGEWLQRLSAVFQSARSQASPPPGMTGEVLALRETPYGLIVIGGPGPNTYDLDQRFALVLDVGGDDTYRGMIAAPADVEQGISVVIDLSGNDTYRPSPLGLATGRLGVGLLIDRSGDDVYQLSQGSGGAGFAGLGILVDTAGDDRYVGAKFTQGAAIGGLGLLLDQAGNDTYTSFGYAIGFGGPLGIGAVLDVAGDDQYQCGGKYPSSYNEADAPGGKPDDPLFQYECFGLGTGSGKRIYSTDPEQRVYGLAGGWGVLIDLAGNDRYRSSNFSQGCGYFYGVGLKLDMAGDDEHSAARYGHAAGAHFGVGLFIDYRGDDVYTSTGPHYNGGAAWDLSVMLGIDSGQGNDLYDLRRSSGLGIADHRSWSLFIEEGGRDRYLVPNGLGMASNSSMSGFFDLGGEDEYAITPQSDRAGSGGRANGRVFLDQGGGLFIDR